MAGEQKGKVHHKDLMRMLPTTVWDDFSFVNRLQDEVTILVPALERLGYSNVVFSEHKKTARTETRKVEMTNRLGKVIYALYG
jgi:hypothetical protein